MSPRIPRLPSRSLGILSGFFLLLAFGQPALADKAIDFTLKDLNGNPVSLSDFKGKNIVLVDFWATWCIPCMKELTHFQRFYDLYKDKGLEILAIAVDGPDSVSMVKPYMNRYKYTFPVLYDTESQVLAVYNPRVIMPYTFIVDKQGNIRYSHQGYSLGDEKLLEAEILKLLQPAAESKAETYSLRVTEAFLYRNFGDKDYVNKDRGGRDNQIINQLEVSLAMDNFLVGARWDEHWSFSPWQDKYDRKERWDEALYTKYGLERVNDFRMIGLRKSFLEYNLKGFSLRAGDFYHTVGRGLAFSLLKTFEKEGLEYIIDTTVDGGKTSFRSKAFTAEAFGGWITRGQETLRETTPVRDTVLGGTLGWRIKSFAELKVNFIGSSIEPGSLPGNRDVTMESLSLEIPNWKDRMKFYGEALLIQKKKWYQEETTINGHGIYLESAFFLKNVTLLAEFKNYRHLVYEYNRPPLLETEQLPIVANQFVDSADDVTGVSGRIDYYFPGSSTLLFSKLTYQNDKKKNHARDIVHVFAGYEKKFRESGWWTFIGGYRRESSGFLDFWDTAGKTLHAQANMSYPFNKRWSLELDLEGKDFNGELSLGGKMYNYYETRSYVSLNYSPHYVVTVFYDHTTDPKTLTLKDKKDWLGAQVEVRFGQSNAVRLFYGAQKGGVKCAGGICKFFAPYEGLRFDLILRF